MAVLIRIHISIGKNRVKCRKIRLHKGIDPFVLNIDEPSACRVASLSCPILPSLNDRDYNHDQE